MLLSKINITREMLDQVHGLSSREAAKVLGVGKTSVAEARSRAGIESTAKSGPKPSATSTKAPKNDAAPASSFADNGDGSLLIETQDTVPQTLEDIHARMIARGFSPDDYMISYRFSEWEAQTPNGIVTMYAARAGATERVKRGGNTVPTVDYEEALHAINAFGLVDHGGTEVPPENTFVFCFADPQLGKTDINGGTAETIQRFMESLAHAESLLTQKPATLIVWADLGDGIENFCNTSSQRQTNDLNLVEQVRILRRLQMEGLSRLSAHAPVVHVSVPSNHSQNRVGFQQPSSTAHDDWGIEVQSQLADVFSAAERDNVTFVKPDEHMESVSLAVPGDLTLGFVHGHRSNSQNALEQWWQGQALGRQPVADADILLVGHFHNLSVRSVGNERYIITTPALDNGSSWFTVSRGNVATAGVLTFRIEGGAFRDLLIV